MPLILLTAVTLALSLAMVATGGAAFLAQTFSAGMSWLSSQWVPGALVLSIALTVYTFRNDTRVGALRLSLMSVVFAVVLPGF